MLSVCRRGNGPLDLESSLDSIGYNNDDLMSLNLEIQLFAEVLDLGHYFCFSPEGIEQESVNVKLNTPKRQSSWLYSNVFLIDSCMLRMNLKALSVANE